MGKIIKYVCNCDFCGKEIENAKRFSIKLGVGNWDDDSVETKVEKDLCPKCYEDFFDMIEEDHKHKEPKKKSRGVGRGRWGARIPDESIEMMKNLWLSGYTRKAIAANAKVSVTTVDNYIRRFKAEGLSVDHVSFEETAEPITEVSYETIRVDAEGFLI